MPPKRPIRAGRRGVRQPKPFVGGRHKPIGGSIKFEDGSYIPRAKRRNRTGVGGATKVPKIKFRSKSGRVPYPLRYHGEWVDSPLHKGPVEYDGNWWNEPHYQKPWFHRRWKRGEA